MPTALDQVREFHTATGLSDRLDAPTMDVGDGDRALRRSLLREEAREVRDGLEEGDLVAVADGLADTAYIVYGTAVTYGIPVADHVHADPPAPGGRDGVPAADTAQLADDVDRAVTTCELAERTGDAARFSAALDAAARACRNAADALAIPLGAVFDEVHASNMSKADDDGVIHRRADGKVLKGAHYTPPDVAGVLAASRHR